jgi:elongation factor P
MQYLYQQGDDYYFMDTRNYEQTFMGDKVLGESKNYLKENIEASVLFYNGKAIGVSLPNSVDLKVVKCDPGIRGDTVSGATKPATLETGYVVNVPLFINEGDVLKIDTRDGKYLTRVATA